MEEIYTFAGNPLDRMSQRRRDADWIASLLDDPQTRVLPVGRRRGLGAHNRLQFTERQHPGLRIVEQRGDPVGVAAAPLWSCSALAGGGRILRSTRPPPRRSPKTTPSPPTSAALPPRSRDPTRPSWPKPVRSSIGTRGTAFAPNAAIRRRSLRAGGGGNVRNAGRIIIRGSIRS